MLPSDAMMKKNGKRTGASNPNPNPNPNGKRTGASFVRAKLLVPSVSFGEEFLAMYDEEPSAEDAVIRIVAPRSMRSMRQVRNTKTQKRKDHPIITEPEPWSLNSYPGHRTLTLVTEP